MPAAAPVYVRSRRRAAIRQGEVLSGLGQMTVEPSSLLRKRQLVSAVHHEYAIVVSPDCDLDWDFMDFRFPVPGAAAIATKEQSNVLLCQVQAVSDGARLQNFERDIWRRVSQNQDIRYHMLEGVPTAIDSLSEGTPPLLVSLKQCFSVPTGELYWRLARQGSNPHRALRRAVLETPYREDLGMRLAHFQSRVALPRAMDIRA